MFPNRLFSPYGCTMFDSFDEPKCSRFWISDRET
jgi:hypothetical protein